jgi:PAS domain S-box-containing protein
MTIKRRLILLLYLLSVAILAMALMGGWALYRADHDATRVYHQRVVTMHDLTVISDLFDDTIHNAGLRFVAGRAQLGDTVTVMSLARDRAFALWRSYRATQLTGQLPRTARQLSEEVEASMRDVDVDINYLAKAAAQHAALSKSQDPDSLERIEDEIEPDLDRLGSLFASLSDQQLSVAEQDYQSAHRYFSWGLAGVLGAAVAAVISLALVVLIVIRRVTRPLGEALMSELGTPADGVPGETGQRGNISRDEISAVIDTLRQFRRDLSSLTSLQAAQAQEANAFRAQLEAIFRHAPLGVYMKDVEGRMLMISEAAASLWGRDRDDMIGKIDTTWSREDEAETIRATNRQVLETGEPVTIEYRGQAPNTYDWMLTVKFPVRDETGKIISLGGVDIDISESRRQMENLRLASTQLQNVKRLAHMYYWSRRVDPITRITKSFEVDRGLCDLLGHDTISDDDVVYANEVVHPDDRAAMLAIYQAFGAHERDSYQIEYRALRAPDHPASHPDGQVVYLRVWVERMRDRANGDFLVAGVVQDITREKQREAQLMAAKTEAEASDRAKSEFLTNMSHELRTPLNAVIGYSDLLRMNRLVQDDARISGYVDAVNESGRNLLEIINAILDISRLESTHPDLQETVFALAPTLAEIERLVALRAESRGITLHFPQVAETPATENRAGEAKAGIAGSIDPGLTIRAENRAFRQILMNILSNAIKFTSQGGSVTLSLTRQSGGELAIEISDTGIGIEPDLIPLLTIPFTQAGSAWTRPKGGIGLGLAIARKLLNLHQGSLKIDSTPGVGTRVTLVFPAERMHWDPALPAHYLDKQTSDAR